MTKAIQWNEYFVTGMEQVDEQHRHLLMLTNQLGEQVISNQISPVELNALIGKLVEYTEYHFDEEEKMMAMTGVDPQHMSHQRNEHASFLQYVSLMTDDLRTNDEIFAKRLLEYLTRWLAFHILGSDQKLARQVYLIKTEGLAAKEAYAQSNRSSESGATEMLLEALNGLFVQLSERNVELTKLNHELEKKVLARTDELSAANQRLEEMALTDALTNLPNRRHAMTRLETLWKEHLTQSRPLSCLMVDADGFKEINDKYGHDAGDAVLRELSGALCNSVRTDDFVARLGGDEFIVICPTTDHGPALQIAQQIVANVAAMSVPAGDGIWQGSVSIGVATSAESMEDIAELIKTSDRALYSAKGAGKGCAHAAATN